MFQKNEFKAMLARKEVSNEDVAKALNISVAAVYRKVNGQSDFYRSEIEEIRKLLDLTPEDVLNIFFAKQLTEK